ncbi:unnamed protein product [Lota lota]
MPRRSGGSRWRSKTAGGSNPIHETTLAAVETSVPPADTVDLSRTPVPGLKPVTLVCFILTASRPFSRVLHPIVMETWISSSCERDCSLSTVPKLEQASPVPRAEARGSEDDERAAQNWLPNISQGPARGPRAGPWEMLGSQFRVCGYGGTEKQAAGFEANALMARCLVTEPREGTPTQRSCCLLAVHQYNRHLAPGCRLLYWARVSGFVVPQQNSNQDVQGGQHTKADTK